MTKNDEGGYLIPHEYAYVGWVHKSIPRNGWRRIFRLIADALHWTGYYFMRAGQTVRPYGTTTEKVYIKGILESLIDEHGSAHVATRYDLPQEPYDDLLFGREHDHDLR